MLGAGGAYAWRHRPGEVWLVNGLGALVALAGPFFFPRQVSETGTTPRRREKLTRSVPRPRQVGKAQVVVVPNGLPEVGWASRHRWLWSVTHFWATASARYGGLGRSASRPSRYARAIHPAALDRIVRRPEKKSLQSQQYSR